MSFGRSAKNVVQCRFYFDGNDYPLKVWAGPYDAKMSDAWILARARMEAREEGKELPREIRVVREL
jgi:hypothetical protein